ncbi:hypothetical protein SRHO_G00263420 [Serrasalmus rhombeus]
MALDKVNNLSEEDSCRLFVVDMQKPAAFIHPVICSDQRVLRWQQSYLILPVEENDIFKQSQTCSFFSQFDSRWSLSQFLLSHCEA